jgi:anthranilate phosphoribosyltransferase
LGAKPDDPIRPSAILETILRSVKGELPEDQTVSEAQMGAFFAAMTIRKGFPKKTQWSEAEIAAFDKYRSDLERLMPPEIRFIMQPELGFTDANPDEAIVVDALEKILRGGHLSYDETRRMGEAILNGKVNGALKGAALIGQRMNLESYDEVRGYLDATFSPEGVRNLTVESLTHFGQPFDGATRYFRPTLFIAAVRAALSEPTVLHGVDEMPPKSGITEEKVLHVLGARTDLSLDQAASLIEDPAVGFAYVSQREYSPGAYNVRELRVHIKKRPPWAATEKAQQLFTASGENYMVIGYYHPGYETPLLQLIWERGFHAGLVVKGEEGTSHYALRLGSPSTEERQAINYSQGFRRVDERREDFSLDIDPAKFGFDYEKNPRIETVSPEAFASAGMEALSGGEGQIYDRLVLNTAITDYLLGICSDPHEAIERTKEAIDSGRALAHLKAYIAKSHL